MKIISPFMVIIILIFVSSCAASQDQSQMETVNNMDDIREKDYYYVIPEEKRKTFLVNVVKVNLGDSRKKVIEILGKPTNDQVMMRKENREIIGRDIDYYFKRYEEGLVNEKYDRVISFYFDKEDKLTKITTNVEEILDLKLPIVKPMLRFWSDQ